MLILLKFSIMNDSAIEEYNNHDNYSDTDIICLFLLLISVSLSIFSIYYYSTRKELSEILHFSLGEKSVEFL